MSAPPRINPSQPDGAALAHWQRQQQLSLPSTQPPRASSAPGMVAAGPEALQDARNPSPRGSLRLQRKIEREGLQGKFSADQLVSVLVACDGDADAAFEQLKAAARPDPSASGASGSADAPIEL